LVEALKDVFIKVPNTIAIFAGYNTKIAPYLMKRAKELGISDRIIIRKQHTEEEKYMLFSAADVYVLPTLTDVFPITALEAMTFGRPVVISNITGVSEIIEQMKTGVLVKPASIEDITDAIVRLLTNNNLRVRLGMQARTKILSEYTWDKVVRNYIKVYLDILSSYKH